MKYLNNIIEQHHQFTKRLINPEMSFGSFKPARRTLNGYEAMNVIRNFQVEVVEKEAINTHVKFIAFLEWLHK